MDQIGPARLDQLIRDVELLERQVKAILEAIAHTDPELDSWIRSKFNGGGHDGLRSH